MKGKEEKNHQSQSRVVWFGAANPAVIPPPVGPASSWTPLTRQYDQLDSIVKSVNLAVGDQSLATKGILLAATDEPSLCRALREELRTVTQVAQALAKEVPGIGTLTTPEVRGTANLLKDADTLIRQASTYEGVLVEHGLAPDFIAQLKVAREKLVASGETRGAARAARVKATKDIASSISMGNKLVKLMDAAITKALRNDPGKLAEWKHVRRVTRSNKGGTGSTNSSTLMASTPASAAGDTHVA